MEKIKEEIIGESKFIRKVSTDRWEWWKQKAKHFGKNRFEKNAKELFLFLEKKQDEGWKIDLSGYLWNWDIIIYKENERKNKRRITKRV